MAEEKEKAVEVVAGLFWEKGRFLIARRPAHKARGGLFEFVGGKVEPGETPEEALKRECLEEMDIGIEVKNLYADVLHDYEDITVHLSVYEAKISRGTPKLNEHQEIRWILPEEIRAFDFCPADESILRKIEDSAKIKNEGK